jgi:hypothetical protein
MLQMKNILYNKFPFKKKVPLVIYMTRLLSCLRSRMTKAIESGFTVLNVANFGV